MQDQPRKVGPYTLITKLGAGAFGVVWLAEKQSAITTTRFALKMPRDEDIDVEAFKQEAKIWVQANGHPNVVPLIDADVYDGNVVIVSEYMPDGSLGSWLERNGGRAPSFEAACAMMEGILSGLSHLHDRRIIHRDLKPENILLQHEVPCLADFGIARLLRTDSYSNNISGTLAYMAPEAFDGKRNERTDVWAAGVLLYKLLSGRLPFPQTDTASLVGAITRYDPPPLSEEIPEHLRSIVATSLRRNPEERYASAKPMRQAIRYVQRSVPLSDTLASNPVAHETPSGEPGPTIFAGDSQPDSQTTLESDRITSRQPPIPIPHPPVSQQPKSSGVGWLFVALTLVLLLGVLGAAVAVAVYSSRNSTTTTAATEPSTPKASNIRTWMKRARDDDSLEPLLQELNHQLIQVPSDALALRARQAVYAATYRDDKAREDALNVEGLLVNPTTADEFEARCAVRTFLSKWEDALTDCTRAVTLDSQYWQALRTRGLLYANRGDYDLAIGDLSKVIEMDPSGLAYANRAAVYALKHDFEAALADHSKSIELSPLKAGIWSARADTYASKGDYDQAIADCNRALQLNPNELLAYYERGTCYLAKGNFEKAIADGDKAIAVAPEAAEGYMLRANAQTRKGQLDRALVDANKAIEHQQNSPVYYLRCLIYYQKQQLKEAIADCDKSLEFSPRNSQAYQIRGVAYLGLHELDKAEADLNKAVELDPKNPTGYNLRAFVFDAKGDAARAAADREKAKQLSP